MTRVRLKRQNCYKIVIVAVSLSLNTYLLITIIDLFAITVQFRLQGEVGLASTFRWSLTLSLYVVIRPSQASEGREDWAGLGSTQSGSYHPNKQGHRPKINKVMR